MCQGPEVRSTGLFQGLKSAVAGAEGVLRDVIRGEVIQVMGGGGGLTV